MWQPCELLYTCYLLTYLLLLLLLLLLVDLGTRRPQRPRTFTPSLPLLLKSKVEYTDIAVRSLTCHTATGTHMPYGITQRYLPPDRGDILVFTPAEAGTRLSDPGGMQG